jgi:hypothetical protein
MHNWYWIRWGYIIDYRDIQYLGQYLVRCSVLRSIAQAMKPINRMKNLKENPQSFGQLQTWSVFEDIVTYWLLLKAIFEQQVNSHLLPGFFGCENKEVGILQT